MAIQYSTDVRNAKLEAVPTEIGASPTLEIRTGSPPANCAAEDSGTALITISLPATWMDSASNGSIGKTGVWSAESADASGTAAHFRIKASGGTCHMQGTVSELGGGGDMELQQANADIVEGQPVTVISFTITDNNG